MNEDANDIFKSLLAKANRNLINECAELREKLQAAEDSAELGRQLTKAYSKLSDGYLAQAQAYDDLNRLYMESVKRAEDAEARVKELEQDNAQLREWIREQGKHTDTCTYHILGREICTYCRCHRMPNATQGGAK